MKIVEESEAQEPIDNLATDTAEEKSCRIYKEVIGGIERDVEYPEEDE